MSPYFLTFLQLHILIKFKVQLIVISGNKKLDEQIFPVTVYLHFDIPMGFLA